MDTLNSCKCFEACIIYVTIAYCKNLILAMGMALSFDRCRKHDPRETKENLWPAYRLFLSKIFIYNLSNGKSD
jgi:hypothetical protein